MKTALEYRAERDTLRALVIEEVDRRQRAEAALHATSLRLRGIYDDLTANVLTGYEATVDDQQDATPRPTWDTTSCGSPEGEG